MKVDRCNVMGERELVTFRVDGMLLGLDIARIQEIHREMSVTPVPRVPEFVRGVMNLRGEVVTIVDLRMVLRGEPADLGPNSKSVVVQSEFERIALVIDEVGDVVPCSDADIEPLPSNVRANDRKFFAGIKQMEGELLIELDLDQLIAETVRDQSEGEAR